MERMLWKRPYLRALDSTGRTEGVGSRVKEKRQSINYHCKMRAGWYTEHIKGGKETETSVWEWMSRDLCDRPAEHATETVLNSSARRPLREGPSPPPPALSLRLSAWCSGTSLRAARLLGLCTAGSRRTWLPPGLPRSTAPAPSPQPLHEAQPRPCSPGSYHSEAGAGPATSPFRAGAEEDARPLRFPLSPAARLGLSRGLRPACAIPTLW